MPTIRERVTPPVQAWLGQAGRAARGAARRHWFLLACLTAALGGAWWLVLPSWRHGLRDAGPLLYRHAAPLALVVVGLAGLAVRARRWWRQVWRPTGTPRRRSALPVADRVPLFLHVALLLLLAVVVAVVVGALMWLLLSGTHLAPAGPAGAGSTSVWTVANTFDAVKIVLSVVAGIGGVVALTVAYRKQDHGEAAERREQTKLFNERFRTAAEQLGSDKAAVRLAGVYAMASLADDWAEGQQTCIDVLCAYLRMPPPTIPVADPPAPDPADALAEAPTEAARPLGPVDAREAAEERQVRDTVLRLIRDHLRPARDVNLPHWHGRRFDLTGAVFDGGDLTRIRIETGTALVLAGAHFSGGVVDFDGATFTGGTVSFVGATFASGRVNFFNARFSGGLVNFDRASLSGTVVLFAGARFTGGKVSFGGATLAGGAVGFDGAAFSGSVVNFLCASLVGGELSFGNVRFSGGTVDFAGATLRGSEVKFQDATLAGG